MFCSMIGFYGEALLAPRPSPKLEDHTLSAVCDSLFNVFTAILHIGGHSSICSLRTCHSVVTGTHLSQIVVVVIVIIIIIIIIIIISFMQGIYTYIPETNHVPREYSISAIIIIIIIGGMRI